MSLINRNLPKFVLLASLFSGIFLAGLTQPSPTGPVPTPGPTTAGPAGAGPGMFAPGQLPPMLQGTLTADEFKQYATFQQQLNEDPALKDINAKIAKLTKEIQQLRVEANATREKLMAANPEIKKIADKIKASMPSRPGNGPMPMPMPMPTPPKSN